MTKAVKGTYVSAVIVLFFFFSSRRRHTRFDCDWSSDVCSSDLRRESTRNTPTVQLPVSKTVVAALLGMKKETLSRLLRQFTADGVIGMTRREIDRKSVV